MKPYDAKKKSSSQHSYKGPTKSLPVCVRIWAVSFDLVTHACAHNVHTKGLSPVWVLTCASTDDFTAAA
jgi:hypothetical protein